MSDNGAAMPEQAPAYRARTSLLPHWVTTDPYWASALHILSSTGKLWRKTQPHLDVRNIDNPHGNGIDFDAILTEGASGGEQAMIRLAWHLYNGETCDVIGSLDRLDDTAYATVMDAFDLRRELMRR